LNSYKIIYSLYQFLSTAKLRRFGNTMLREAVTDQVLIREIVRYAEPGRWSEEDFASGMLDARAKPRPRAILRVVDHTPEAEERHFHGCGDTARWANLPMSR